jgi:hypothetical protein
MSKQTDLINIPDAITVDGSNVGIGETSPSHNLHVSSSSGSTLALTAGSTENAQIRFGDSSDDDAGKINYDNSSNHMALHTNAAERIRIDSSGNVGINTAVLTSAGQSGKLKVRNDVDYSSTEFEDNATLLLQNETDNHSASLVFHSDNATGSSKRAGIVGGNINSNTSALGFYGDISGKTSATKPDVIIYSSGKVLIGTEPDDTSSNGWSSTSGVQDSSRDSTASRTHYTFRNPNGSVGSIQTSGSSTGYNTSSDYRLKENVVDLTGASARVNQLNPSRFNFIVDDTNTLVDGFLAHEVATVVPEAITGTKDAMMDEEYEVTPAVLDEEGAVVTEAVMGTRSVPDYQGIDQSKLVPLLTAALQEALTEIASLKTRVEALEA